MSNPDIKLDKSSNITLDEILNSEDFEKLSIPQIFKIIKASHLISVIFFLVGIGFTLGILIQSIEYDKEKYELTKQNEYLKDELEKLERLNLSSKQSVTKSEPLIPRMVPLDSEFAISRYEITNEEYFLFVKSSGYDFPESYDTEKFNDPLQPIVGISWYDAMAYCEWLSNKTGNHYSLPSKSQWKKAAGCKNESTYPWGGEPPDKILINFGKKNDHPLKVIRPGAEKSNFGIIDMSGNVAEWCIDQIDNKRLVCGGAWIDNSIEYLRCDFIRKYPPSEKKNFVGFRIVEILNKN